LDIAEEVLQLHGSTMRIIDEDGLYTVSFELPIA
jgi:hypothetical protein